MDNIEQAWVKIRNNIIASASETIVSRRFNTNTKTTKQLFRRDVKTLVANKSNAYITYRNNKHRLCNGTV